ncbi:cell wall-active antibiotics response protein LiaF [Evansella sp. AB-P1]|uniref:cell wall-active antibiotics response protein LiaF n=1 Tax=Evansella sp. AB-P1 TaxID=3037653 RepID=UPI00241F331C|nr:cell wall-active antibiotics response protein LiaF [Evansella sp. AB-P1]MDG5789150.1 cell wall-active antibiotics response protein LiaF [Evansella sp. AB-P1]
MKKIIGLLILTIGIIFLLSNMGLIDTNAASLLSTFWPILIVIIGMKVFIEGVVFFFHSLRRSKLNVGKLIWGAIILAVGIVILGNNAGWFYFRLSDLWSWTWPLLIVYVGFKIIFDRNKDVVINLETKDNDNRNNMSNRNQNYIKKKHRNRVKYNTFIGEVSLGKKPFEIDDADISMTIGSIEVDLTRAILKTGENHVDIQGWIGDVEILVPREMAIKAFVNVRLGDVTLFDDSYSGTGRNATYTSPNFHEAEKKVILHVNLNIGDVEVLTVD